jgi:enoyl-CoA hydratase
MPDPIRYTRDDDVGILALDRPDQRNRMTPELLDAFAAASASARADAGARCIVVTGSGSAFSVGGDLRSALQRTDGDRVPHERSFAMYEPFLSLLDIAVPVIGALNGHAIGGGFGLALLCDLRIGALEGKYGANFVRLGLAPGMAISYMLPHLIGAARASELLLTGRLVDGREAERLGILNRAVPAAGVMTEAMALAREIAAAAPLAVRATKRAIRRGLELAARDAARLEAYAQAETLATDDAREGIAAQLEKRSPRFTGR